MGPFSGTSFNRLIFAGAQNKQMEQWQRGTGMAAITLHIAAHDSNITFFDAQMSIKYSNTADT